MMKFFGNVHLLNFCKLMEHSLDLRRVPLIMRNSISVSILLGIQLFGIIFLCAQEEPQNSKASAAAVQQQQPQNFVYDDHGKRDPFWTLVTPAGVIINYDSDILISDMVLEGIIAGADGKNLAIINNTIVKPNDQVGLFVIEKIGLDKVLLRKGQESFALKIKKEE